MDLRVGMKGPYKRWGVVHFDDVLKISIRLQFDILCTVACKYTHGISTYMYIPYIEDVICTYNKWWTSAST